MTKCKLLRNTHLSFCCYTEKGARFETVDKAFQNHPIWCALVLRACDITLKLFYMLRNGEDGSI